VEELASLAGWFLLELLLIHTGRAVVFAVSLGRWRGEQIEKREGRIYGTAGALSFKRDGRRVITVNGMLFLGVLFYIALAVALMFVASH
jgi:hypothetical protein